MYPHYNGRMLLPNVVISSPNVVISSPNVVISSPNVVISAKAEIQTKIEIKKSIGS